MTVFSCVWFSCSWNEVTAHHGGTRCANIFVHAVVHPGVSWDHRVALRDDPTNLQRGCRETTERHWSVGDMIRISSHMSKRRKRLAQWIKAQ